jgi:hypothetical protein
MKQILAFAIIIVCTLGVHKAASQTLTGGSGAQSSVLAQAGSQNHDDKSDGILRLGVTATVPSTPSAATDAPRRRVRPMEPARDDDCHG